MCTPLVSAPALCQVFKASTPAPPPSRPGVWMERKKPMMGEAVVFFQVRGREGGGQRWWGGGWSAGSP